MQTDDRFLELVSKQLSANITQAEEQELAVLLQDDAFAQQYQQLLQTWKNSEELGLNLNPDVAAAWQKVRARIAADQGANVTVLKMRPLFSYLKYAAAITFICAVSLLLYQQFSNRTITVVTETRERKHVILPDHSDVWLNESSELSYANNFNKTVRWVKLQGEAFFKVTKNPARQFVVNTGSADTHVYGTSFNVRAIKNEDQQVSLLEGKVSFSDVKNSWVIMLRPGEAAYLNRNGSHGKRPISDHNFLFWKNHELKFVNRPLKSVLDEIGVQYHCTFTVPDAKLAGTRITTNLKADSLKQAVQVLQVLLDVRIVKKDNVYIVQPQTRKIN